MNITIGINPNCSEAVVRIRTDGQDPAKIKALMEKLDLEIPESDYFAGENKLKTEPDWDDEGPKREFEWSDAYLSEEVIFGVNCIKVQGDAPFNFNDDFREIINRFLPDADQDWSEN